MIVAMKKERQDPTPKWLGKPFCRQMNKRVCQPGMTLLTFLFCEQVIEDLCNRAEKASRMERVNRAEGQISGLMSKLSIGSSSPLHRQGRKSSPLPQVTGTQPSQSLDHRVTFGLNSSYRGQCLRPIVEESDSKDFIAKLPPEAHLILVKSYESMNYRELILGMDGVHFHLLNHGKPMSGYELHCNFVKRKSVNFLYSNLASVLYDKYVIDRVVSGEYIDYSSCPDACLEFFCESYRRESQKATVGIGNKGGQKPWSGYPYPYCFFHNEWILVSKFLIGGLMILVIALVYYIGAVARIAVAPEDTDKCYGHRP